eukprot:m.9576 g.9576  ORF g.9576 m.9576 type:complete len:60 (+) comp4196_c0_seq1:1-180(+)
MKIAPNTVVDDLFRSDGTVLKLNFCCSVKQVVQVVCLFVKYTTNSTIGFHTLSLQSSCT